jgi:hypothetical protein
MSQFIKVFAGLFEARRDAPGDPDTARPLTAQPLPLYIERFTDSGFRVRKEDARVRLELDRTPILGDCLFAVHTEKGVNLFTCMTTIGVPSRRPARGEAFNIDMSGMVFTLERTTAEFLFGRYEA